jgi:hypothetical protein
MNDEQIETETEAPAAPATAAFEGKEIHLNFTGMSGRVVRFSVMTPEKVEAIEDNAARGAGEEAEHKDIRRAQLKSLVAGMIHSYSPPDVAPKKSPRMHKGKPLLDHDGTQLMGIDPFEADPTALAKATFTPNKNAATLELALNDIFTTKDIAALQALYVEHHEMNPLEMQMILGKSRAVRFAG